MSHKGFLVCGVWLWCKAVQMQRVNNYAGGGWTQSLSYCRLCGCVCWGSQMLTCFFAF